MTSILFTSLWWSSFNLNGICISSKIHLLQYLNEKHSLTNTVVLFNGLNSSEGTVNPERKPSGLSKVCESKRVRCSVVSNLDCSPYRLLCPWDSPGKNTGVGCHSLLQGIFPTQGSNQGLLHLYADSLPLSYQRRHPGNDVWLADKMWVTGLQGQEEEVSSSPCLCPVCVSTMWKGGRDQVLLHSLRTAGKEEVLPGFIARGRPVWLLSGRGCGEGNQDAVVQPDWPISSYSRTSSGHAAALLYVSVLLWLK